MINAIGWIFILFGILAFLAFCGAEARNRSYVICSFYAMLIFLLVGIILVNL